MGLFDFMRREKALTASSTVLSALENRQLNMLPTLGGTNVNYGRINSAVVEVQNASYSWFYRYCPPARRVIAHIARNAAQLDVKVFERVADDERKHLGDHPAAEAIRRPNPATPGTHFMFSLFVDYLAYDNAYALKVPQAGGGLQLYNLPAGYVGILGKNLFAADGYRIWNPYGGEPFDVSPDQILHWRGHNPDKPRQGESNLETLRNEIASDQAALTAVTELHRSGLSLKAWLERPLEAPELDNDGRRNLSEAVTNWAKKATREIPVFEEGTSYKTGGVTPEDAQYLESRSYVSEAIASLYGLKNVPPATEDERKQFYADVLPPYCEFCASFLDLHILQGVYNRDDLYFEFSNEKVMDEVYKTLTSASGRPVLLTNEARAKVDLPALDGGDDLLTPANMLGEDVPSPKPSTGVMPIQDPNKPPQDGSARSTDAPTPVPARQASLNGHGDYKAILSTYRRHLSRRNGNWAREYGSTVGRHFSRQERSLKSLKARPEASNERWDNELAADLLTLSLRHFATEGKHAAFHMASSFDASHGENWLIEKAKGSAKEINRTTQDHIEEKGLDDAFAYARDVRASAAGVSYSGDVSGFSTKVAIEQTPDSERREVVIDGGDCPQCAEFQGVWPVDEVPAWPAYHANCNCVAEGKSIEASTKSLELVADIFRKALESNEQGIKAVAEAIRDQEPAQFDVNADTHIHEGAVKHETTIQPGTTSVTVDKGAIELVNNVDLPAQESKTVFEKGAFENHNHTPITVEPAQNFIDSPTTVEGSEISIQPEVTVKNQEEQKKRTVTFEDGRQASIERDGNKQIVTFSDGRKAEIEENND